MTVPNRPDRVGDDVRGALRRMARIPRPRERRVHWLVAGIVAALVLCVQLFMQADWMVFGLGFAIVFGAVAAFVAVGRLWGWVALAIGLGLGLGAIPLFGVLGLELSLAVALFISLAGADLGCALAREMARSRQVGIGRATYPVRTLFRGALAGSGLAVAIGLVPAIIAAFRGIVVPTCDWWFGITSYIAMPLASAALAGAIGHAIGALTGPRRFGPAWLAQLPALFVACAALYSFYSTPPVYTYNAVLGYFPGNMYDENVSLAMPLLWSRLEQLLWVIAVIALVAFRFDVATYRVRRHEPRPAGSRGHALALAVLAVTGAVILRLNGGTLGFAVDAEDLETALGAKIETEHFIIYYSPSPEIERDIQLIAEDHEFRYAQLVEQLGVQPDHKLVSFYFANKEQKYRLHGSRDVEMAKPWRGEIYLEHREFPHGSLRHEIAHDIAAEFGDPVFGVSSKPLFGFIPLAVPGMIEGLAVAVDGPERGNLHEHARIIQKLDKLPSVDLLFSLSFFSISPTQGYTTAGSFLRFLLDKYGAPKLRELYRTGGDFDRAYNISRARLEGEWRTMLSQIQIPDAIVESQRERFRGVSVFSRPCPHAIAKRQQTALRRLGQGDRAGAIDVMRQICEDSLFEPRYRLILGDFLSGDEATKPEADLQWMLLAVNNRHVTVSVRAQAFRRLARAAALRNELDRAAQLLAYARTLPIDLDERRELDAMAFTLAHRGPAAPHLRAYFFPTEKDPTSLVSASAAVAAEPTLGIAHYLLGLQRFNADDYAAAAASLEAALARDLPGLAFVKNAARRLAIAAYRTRDYARLTRATNALSSPEMTGADRLLAKDWLERVAFSERRGRR